MVTAAAKLYASKLVGLTPKQVMRGLAKATDRKFMPNPFEFSECCRPTAADFGFPEPSLALYQLEKWRRSRGGFNEQPEEEILPVIYTTYRRMDIFNWDRMPEKEYREYFEYHYQNVIADHMNGAALQEPQISIAEESVCRPPSTPEKADESISKLKDIMGVKA